MAITIFSITPDTIRGDQLADEILQTTGIDVSGRYSFHPPDEVHIAGDDVAEEQAAIQAVIDSHTPDPLYFPEDAEQARQEQAEQDYANLPAWARWTGDQMADYITTNVTDLASAKTVLLAMARMHAAERNRLWPNLEGS